MPMQMQIHRYGMTIKEVLSYSTQMLTNVGIESPILESQVMLCRLLGMKRTEIIANSEANLPNDQIDMYMEWVNRRCNREPLPYITGIKEFYGIEFMVTPHVLIPRPETELLVEQTLKSLDGIDNPIIADIGCGSGAIGISIAKSIPSAHIYGVDVSIDALNVTQTNAVRHGVRKNLNLIWGDLLDPLANISFHAIVSNPPYIPSNDILVLEPEVSSYEPRIALDGGSDGLDIYRRLIPKALSLLKPGGVLIVEIGINQSDMVADMFNAAGFADISIMNDYSSIPRVIMGRKNL